jgi:hypothetical protein
MTLARALLWTSTVAALGGCAGRVPAPKPPPPPATAPGSPASLSRIGFSVQVGAFSNLDNAIRLRESLEAAGLEAFHFAGDDGLHRVRFGSFVDREGAIERARALQREGIVDAFYVVPPERRQGTVLRRQVVRSALGFLGTPYRWGGPSPETGFDCSGLTMTSYRLNGLSLPRTSREQFAAGRPVAHRDLREADLVFFATGAGTAPSHVGIYIGEDRFVHAPSSGGVVRVDHLSSSYYRSRFLSGRSYVD